MTWGELKEKVEHLESKVGIGDNTKIILGYDTGGTLKDVDITYMYEDPPVLTLSFGTEGTQ